MKKTLLILTLLTFSFSLFTVSQTISTQAGNGTIGYSGDGGQATAAELNYPRGISCDGAGNIYICDYSNNVIRKINTSGVITTVAGNGMFGYSGDGGQATAAELRTPIGGVVFDAVGNMYISDEQNNVIRKVNTSGIISTVAGTGAQSFSGDGGQATAATLHWPCGVALDVAGNMYIADYGNSRIRKVNTSGIISTIAGNGSLAYSGDGGPSTAAEINYPHGICTDNAGNVYFGDDFNNRVRVINTSGIINTVAGNGSATYGGDGGQATAASIQSPVGVYVDGTGNLYIADYLNYRIREVNTSGVISTLAGNGTNGFSGDGGPATSAELSYPYAVCLDPSNNIYISDADNQRIRKITAQKDTVIVDTGSFCLTLHPSAANGQDWDAAIASGSPATNYGTHPNFMSDIWTCSGPCIIRSLINFDISPIPANATITSATLYLYADPNSSDGVNGSPTYGTSNAGWIERITSSWAVNTVTWNNQPATTATNEVAVPQSSNTSENYTLNVTTLYQDILSSGNNYGIMLQQQQEVTYYNSLIFGSSNNTDSNIHPKLVVCYHVPLAVNTLNNNAVRFDVYPNPATNEVVFKTSLEKGNSNYYVEMFDVTGQNVKTVKLYPYMTTIATDGMARGMYFYRIMKDNSPVKTGKLVLQ